MTTIQSKTGFDYLLIYHFFGLLWTVQFVQGFAGMTIAGAIANWYFSRNENNSTEVEKHVVPLGLTPVISSLCRTLRYYLGTVAIGSFIIALVQFIRVVAEYIMHKMGNTQDNTTRFIKCCVRCCLGCLEWCVKIVSKNAFIYTAIKGEGFFNSAGSVVSIMARNAGVFASINMICEWGGGRRRRERKDRELS